MIAQQAPAPTGTQSPGSGPISQLLDSAWKEFVLQLRFEDVEVIRLSPRHYSHMVLNI